MRRLLTASAVAMLLLLTACGQGSNGGKASDRAAAGQAFARCMRDNGVPDYPDPDPSGRQGAGHEAFDRNDRTFKAANEKCRDLLPGGGEHETPSPEAINELRKFAQCMRANGVAEFSDPGADGRFPREAEQGAHEHQNGICGVALQSLAGRLLPKSDTHRLAVACVADRNPLNSREARPAAARARAAIPHSSG